MHLQFLSWQIRPLLSRRNRGSKVDTASFALTGSITPLDHQPFNREYAQPCEY